MPRRYAHLALCLLIALHAVYGGVGGVGVLCLGGGHEHLPAEDVASCERVCEHGAGRILPAADPASAEDCDCVDAEFSVSEFSSLPRTDECPAPSFELAQVDAWVVTTMGASVSWTGPPTPAWFDPAGAQRLALVSSTRLLL